MPNFNSAVPPSRTATNFANTSGGSGRTMADTLRDRNAQIRENMGGYSASTGMNFDPRIGNGGLPAGIQGSANRAYTRTVQNDQLTSHQLNNLLASDNRYIQDARTRGLEGALSRGLGVFGGMGAGLAERAVIQAVAPIAQADAQAYDQAQAQNLDALNQYNLNALGSGITMVTDRGDQEWENERQRQHQLQMQRENLAFQGEQAGLGRAHEYGMTNLDFGNTIYRDAMQQGYARDNARLQSSLNMRQYQYQTGVDLRQQGTMLFNQLLQMGMAEPDVWTPENIAGFMNFAQPVYDEMTANFFDPIFDSYFLGGW